MDIILWRSRSLPPSLILARANVYIDLHFPIWYACSRQVVHRCISPSSVVAASTPVPPSCGQRVYARMSAHSRIRRHNYKHLGFHHLEKREKVGVCAGGSWADRKGPIKNNFRSKSKSKRLEYASGPSPNLPRGSRLEQLPALRAYLYLRRTLTSTERKAKKYYQAPSRALSNSFGNHIYIGHPCPISGPRLADAPSYAKNEPT
ncbi:hypothetical protein DM02DRAFT_284090 [Periconia macrospinosa]|uniref:Uncharacterized protein n=1 Tax=Periconia macrospinosa TaxID=97972 RepID=A0A2V1EE60_9PLEO|nr:hypothetical protein DM02DRAFT_284090 [Periconia macrospinosa]